jgi:hypothetical protein
MGAACERSGAAPAVRPAAARCAPARAAGRDLGEQHRLVRRRRGLDVGVVAAQPRQLAHGHDDQEVDDAGDDEEVDQRGDRRPVDDLRVVDRGPGIAEVR